MPTALIVGASRGLGRGLAEEHLKRGWNVIATVRDKASLADVTSDALTVETLSTTDWPSVDAFSERLAGRTLDLLFVNAAISSPGVNIGDVDPDAFVEIMLTNVLAPLKLADKLADFTAEDGVVAVMSSRMGSTELTTDGRGPAYRISKAGLNMGLKGIAARRADRRTYLAVDPGWVKTSMGGDSAPLTVEQSITSMADMLQARRGQGGVTFTNYEGQVWPW
jgi:NAD(P)-dependent dehydrogenase (short-subunit alcohol dehydrogenase family)